MSLTLKQMAHDLLTGTLKISSAEVAEERMKLCRDCEQFQPTISRCKLCGCMMVAKTKMMDSSCPADKW